MPIQPIRKVGSAGLILDTSSVLLPLEAWSDGKNVRFNNGSVEKIKGHQSILTTDVEPHNGLYWPDSDVYVYADASDIYTVNASNTSTEISQTGVTYATDGIWHSSLFNGGYTVIMNNTKNIPQFITKDSATGNLANLTAWPSNYIAGVLRPFQNALIAGNINTGTEQRPGSVLVSSQAAPGGIPQSWTVGASLTDSADEFELSQTQPVVEITDYRGTCFIFTGDSIHSLLLAQGTTPTRVQNLNYGNGCLATGCVTQFEGGLFVVDRNDIYTTGGSGDIKSISDAKIREYFFNNLNSTHYENTFTTRNLPHDEIWICYPTLMSTGACDEALIWNYRDNTWSIRELPNARFATTGPIPEDGVFPLHKEYLVFNGFRTSNASEEQRVVMSGTKSNTTAAESASFIYALSGASNTEVAAVSEVQTGTVVGTMSNTDAVVDIQTFELSGTGRSNVIPPAQDSEFEVVEFGFDSDFASSFDQVTKNSATIAVQDDDIGYNSATTAYTDTHVLVSTIDAIEENTIQYFWATIADAEAGSYTSVKFDRTDDTGNDNCGVSIDTDGVFYIFDGKRRYRSTNPFVAAGDYTSASAAGWTETIYTTGFSAIPTRLHVTFHDGLFKAMVNSINATYYTSPDGLVWTLRTTFAAAAAGVTAISVSAVYVSGGKCFYRRTNRDGASYELTSTAAVHRNPVADEDQSAAYANNIVYDADASIYYVFENFMYSTSTDGSTWTTDIPDPDIGTLIGETPDGRYIFVDDIVISNETIEAGDDVYVADDILGTVNVSTVEVNATDLNSAATAISTAPPWAIRPGTTTNDIVMAAPTFFVNTPKIMLTLSTGESDIATYNISNTDENIPAITGTFTSRASATQARTDLKTGLAADAEFTNVFNFTKDTEVAAEVLQVFDMIFSGTITTPFTPNSALSTSFYASQVGASITFPAPALASPPLISTAAQFVDYLVAIYNAATTPDKVGVASKVGTSTFRITPNLGDRFTLGIAGFQSSDLSNAGTLDISLANSDGAIGGQFRSGTSFTFFIFGAQANQVYSIISKKAARYTAKASGNLDDFAYTITNGSAATPYLNVHLEGADVINGTGIATTYTLTDGSGEESTSFTSHVTNAADNDRATVLSNLESAVDNNTETPINYTASVSGNVITLTADDGGANSGNWVLTINNGGVTDPDLVGTQFSIRTNTQIGADAITAMLQLTLTDPKDSGNDYSLLISGNNTAAQIAGEIRDNINPVGFTITGTGADIIITDDSDGPITTLWQYEDDSNAATDVNITFVETAGGVTPIGNSTYQLIDSDGTILSFGTFTSASNTDTAGALIGGLPTQRGTMTYDSATDRLTFSYFDTGVRVRPDVSIVHPDSGNGNLNTSNIGDDTDGQEAGGNPSEYIINFPTGFTPTTLTSESANGTLTSVINTIRDDINAITFTPVDINASVINNQLNLTWAEFNAPNIFSASVDNGVGNGDIVFGTPVNSTISEDSTELHAGDIGNTFNGESYTSFVERKTMDMGDLEAVKWNGSIYPLATGTGNITISTQGSNTSGKVIDLTDVSPQDTRVYDINEDYKVDPRTNGRFFNVRFESTDNDNWVLAGYSLTIITDDRR